MIIESIRLNNFKCFEDETISFSKITVLAGLNGMGKSSVIQSLLLLRQSFKEGLLLKDGLVLNGDLVRLGTAADVLFEDAKEDDVIAFRLFLADGNVGQWRFSYDRQAEVLQMIEARIDDNLLDSSLFSNRFQYLGAERIGPRSNFQMSDFWVRQHRQLGSHGEYAAHFLALYGDENVPNPSLRHHSQPSLQLSRQVEAWMGEICPGTEVHYTAYGSMDLVDLKYSFVTGIQRSNRYRSTNVGFGITYVLPVLISILTLPPNSLLLIENPEAHLHPRGQARIGRLLAQAAASGVQIVVETHSDHVLNGVRIAVHQGDIGPDQIRLHFFQRIVRNEQISAEVISPTIDRNGRINDWPEGFFDEWDRSLETLLEPSR